MRESRRVFAGGAAAIAVLMSLPAQAQEVSYDYGGYANFSGYIVDQTDIPGGDVNDFAFAGDAHPWARAKTILDDGFELGVRGTLEFASSEARYSDDFIRGVPKWLDEFIIYGRHAFGTVTIGLDDGAADRGIYSPVVSEANRVDDARHFVIQDPLQSSFHAFRPNGATIRTDLNASGDAFKIHLATTRLFGLELAVSYTPELTQNPGRIFDGDDEVDRQSNIFEANLNWQWNVSGFDIGVYGGYLIGENEDPSVVVLPVTARGLDGLVATFGSAPFTPDDVEEYGFGGQLGYEGFRLGGSWRHTNVAGGQPLLDTDAGAPLSTGCSQIGGCVLPNADTEIWGAGLTYTTGPWQFGVNYAALKEELPPFDDNTTGPLIRRQVTQEANAWQATVGYEVEAGINLYAGYQRWDYDGPAGGCVTGACDTLDADIGFLQAAFSFP